MDVDNNNYDCLNFAKKALVAQEYESAIALLQFPYTFYYQLAY